MHSISILHTLQMLICQHGGDCKHFHGHLSAVDASAYDSTIGPGFRAYTLRGDPLRKIWLNGEHVASVVRW